jgi:anti-anti-sigma factor
MESPLSSTRCTSRWLTPAIAVVAAHGELDAANAQTFVDDALRHPCSALVLDLTDVEFFGTAAFSALHTLNVRCARGGVDWILVPSAAVSRLLAICDPDATLPTAATLETAAARLPMSLQLVAQPGQ